MPCSHIYTLRNDKPRAYVLSRLIVASKFLIPLIAHSIKGNNYSYELKIEVYSCIIEAGGIKTISLIIWPFMNIILHPLFIDFCSDVCNLVIDLMAKCYSFGSCRPGTLVTTCALKFNLGGTNEILQIHMLCQC
jgi:hypothetical protein